MAYNYANQGINIGMELVDELKEGKYKLQYLYEEAEEPPCDELGHSQFLSFLRTDLCHEVLSELMSKNGRYLLI